MAIENYFMNKFGNSEVPRGNYNNVKFIHASDIHLGQLNIEMNTDHMILFKRFRKY